MEVSNKLDNVRERVRGLVRSRKRLYRVTKAVVIFLFPILHTLMIGFRADLGGIFWLIEGLLIVVHILLGWVIVGVDEDEGFYFDYRELHDECQKLQTGVSHEREEWTQSKYASRVVMIALQALIDFLSYAEDGDGLSEEEVESRLEKILEPMVLLRSEIFRFDGEARWNVALYMYSDGEEELELFFRRVDDRISRRD